MEPKPEWTPEDLDIHTASASVGESERDQIRSRLDGWARDLLVYLVFNFSMHL